jgi:hypothetical protein
MAHVVGSFGTGIKNERTLRCERGVRV